MNFTKRQIEILDVSKELIGAKGIQNLTIKNIANKMSFSEPAIYRHFKDKAEIIKSVLLFQREIIKKGIFKIIESDISSVEKLKTIMDFQFNHFKENPSIITIIFSESSFQYFVAEVIRKMIKKRNQKLIQILKEGQIEGGIRDDISAEQIATIIMGSMRLTVLNWKLSNFETDLTKEGKELWQTIEKLIKK
jgi:AcrR family transcriptional regulator